jgi:hypothetical protein
VGTTTTTIMDMRIMDMSMSMRATMHADMRAVTGTLME